MRLLSFLNIGGDRIWLHHFDLPSEKEKHGDAIMNYIKTTDYCTYDFFYPYRFQNGKNRHMETRSDTHGAADRRLVADWVQAFAQHEPSLLTSTTDPSIKSHVM